MLGYDACDDRLADEATCICCLVADFAILQYAVQSQVKHHGFDPKDALVLIDPPPLSAIINTEQIISTIDEHADSTALILLPGIQYYSGQYLDIPTITTHAHSKGILIGWDLAHAAGNVELSLHDWDVDFAAWCTYKYLNSGPGAIAALFVHEKHGKVEEDANSPDGVSYRPRLSGWWGGRKSLRFEMAQREYGRHHYWYLTNSYEVLFLPLELQASRLAIQAHSLRPLCSPPSKYSSRPP